jgi:hypothetical protein
MKNFISLLLPVCMLAFSCTEEVTPTPYVYTKVLTGETSKAWTIRSISMKEEGKGDVTFSLDDCIKDDHYIFYAGSDRKYELTDGSNKCNASDPDLIISDSWSFVNATASLTIIFPLLSDNPLPYILREAEDDKMTIEIFFDEDKASYRIAFRSTGTEK